MKTATDVLEYLLSTAKVFYMADLYTFTLVDGTIMCYASVDIDITWNGNTFLSRGLLLKRSRISLTKGAEVDTLEISVYPTTATIGGISWLAAVRNGALDGAAVKLERIFFSGLPVPISQPSGVLTTDAGAPITVSPGGEGIDIATSLDAPGAPVGTITLFTGKVSDIDPIGRTAASLKVASMTELFNTQFPINVYDPGCIWALYGAGCGIAAATFTASGSVTGSPTTTDFTTSLTQADYYFNGGVIVFTSGPLTGSQKTVKSYLNTGGAIQPVIAMATLPAAGNTFTIYPGCDRTMDTCDGKFSNLANYRGFPFIPLPETGVY